MTQVICRIDHESKPVIFIADTLNNGRIKAWKEGEDKPRFVGIDYYQNTEPLSEDDSKVLITRYAKATGGKGSVPTSTAPACIPSTS